MFRPVSYAIWDATANDYIVPFTTAGMAENTLIPNGTLMHLGGFFYFWKFHFK